MRRPVLRLKPKESQTAPVKMKGLARTPKKPPPSLLKLIEGTPLGQMMNKNGVVPLAIGFHRLLREHLMAGDMKKWKASEISQRSLNHFTRNPYYQIALSFRGAARYGLDGTAVGPVTEEERQSAKEVLKRSQAMWNLRRQEKARRIK